MSQPAFSKTPFSLTQSSTPTALLGTSEAPVVGNLVAIEITAATPGAHIWAFDTVTGSTAPRLTQSANLGGNLAPGVRIGFNRPFTTGLSVMSTGTVSGNAIVQVA
ncbi:hypothetical protein [Acidisphaera sp. S103]|uniref:hypothetical protein n=1 Tax=Acidisphaera sp. S103 TaxID=1747223 RepID=UPI00131DD0FE|nr:hypothetical protein [Acidisphaera sp. S103]